MTALFISPEAERDLDEIEAYIGEDNPAAASKFIERLTVRFEQLAESPGIGRKRDEILPGFRSITCRPYVILYTVETDTVTIIRVLHGRRDIPAIFPQTP